MPQTMPQERPITKRQLRALRVSPPIYRWFLRRFPQGACYRDIHRALIGDGHSEWLESLVEYAYAMNFHLPQFMRQEIGAARDMADGLNRGAAERLLVTPRHPPGRYFAATPHTLQLASGDHALNIGCSGLQSHVAVSGNGNFIAQSGENSAIASAGYSCQLVGAGFAARISNTGQNSRIASLGERSRISNSGNAVKISSAGRGSYIATSGRRNYLGAIGDAARIASAGDGGHIHTLGADTRIASSGDNASILAAGGGSVICSAGSGHVFTLGKGGCAALAYHDGARTRFLTLYEGENGIRAGVTYRLSADGELETLDETAACA